MAGEEMIDEHLPHNHVLAWHSVRRRSLVLDGRRAPANPDDEHWLGGSVLADGCMLLGLGELLKVLGLTFDLSGPEGVRLKEGLGLEAILWNRKVLSMDTQKIEVIQRGRKVMVYQWAMEAARMIQEATVFTRMVAQDTDAQIYLAEVITGCADGKA